MSLRVFIAYRYPVVLHALKALIERHGYTVAGECADVNQAGDLIGKLQPDIALLDFDLPSARALNVVPTIARLSPNTKVILVTSHTQPEHVLEAVRLEVKGYVLKTSQPDDLIRTIQEVGRGATYFSPEVSRIVVENYLQRGQRNRDQLTGREKEVVRLIADGHSTKQVAAQLGISVKTADSHRTRVMEKLNIHETATLVRYAVRQGLVEP